MQIMLDSKLTVHNVKGKVYPRTATKAQRGSRGIALLFLKPRH